MAEMRDLEDRHVFSSQIGAGGATRVCRAAPAPLASAHVPSSLADALLAVAWGALALDGVWERWRERRARAALGPVVAAPWRPPALGGVLVAAAALLGAVALERLAGRLPYRPAVGLPGLALAGAGLALFAWARRVLGPSWSGTVEVRAGQRLVERGPYARVRHPIYLAVLLLGAGTVLAHPSLATAAVAVGLGTGIALKIRLEERTLRAALDGAWDAYAARVPALLPRLGSPR
jgi:protein-S-isoprenylcysteine O-methyltransferase Ste14